MVVIISSDDEKPCIAASAGKSVRKIVVEPFMAKTAFGMMDLLGRLRSEAGAMNMEKYREITAEGWVADPEKAMRLLGWNPPAELPGLIEETYLWYRENSWL